MYPDAEIRQGTGGEGVVTPLYKRLKAHSLQGEPFLYSLYRTQQQILNKK